MKIAVLGNRTNSCFDQLAEAADGKHHLGFVAWNDLVALVGETEAIECGFSNSPATNDFDVVLVRGMPVGSLEQVVFRMNALARWQACGVRVVNSPRSLEIAIDKYLSLALIRQAGVAVPESIVCQTVAAAMEGFHALGGDVVVKPVFGGEGRGIVRISDPEIAVRTFRTIVNVQSVVYLQRFIDGGNRDYRLLKVGARVYGMSRSNENDWRTNSTRGADCELWKPAPEQLEMAERSMRAVDTDIAGVDLIQDRQGQWFLLEVNGIPGWRAIESVHDVNISDQLINWLERK